MFDRISPNFSYGGSSFTVHKSKESTGRVVMWKEISLVNSYTCEASFCGASQGLYRGFHFNIQMLLDMGKDFCRTLAVYSEPDNSYYKQILQEIQYTHDNPNRNRSNSKDNRNGMDIMASGMSNDKTGKSIVSKGHIKGSKLRKN